MITYDVELTREGKWWMVRIPAIDGLTQARTIKEAHDMARDYIAITLDVPADSFDIHVRAEQIGTVEHVTQLLEDIRIMRAQAEKLEQEAAAKTRDLAVALAAEDLSLREVGAVMGISHQRADQLVRSAGSIDLFAAVRDASGIAVEAKGGGSARTSVRSSSQAGKTTTKSSLAGKTTIKGSRKARRME